jgi:arylsulfatase
MPPFTLGEELSESERLHLLNRYDGEIASLDAYLGGLFEYMKSRGLYENTLIVLISDHGEGFYEHATWRHGNSLYQEMIHAPLIVRFPGGENGGAVIDGVCSLMDLFPTICNILELPRYEHVQGKSLLPMIKNEKDHRELWAMSEMRYADRYYSSLVEGTMKIIHITSSDEEHWRLFDLSKDPLEKDSLSEQDDAVFAKMKSKLRSKLDAYLDMQMESGEQSLSDEDMERLKKLGYGY